MNSMQFKQILKRILGIKSANNGLKKNSFFEFIQPDLIFDVGANSGNSAIDFFGYGYSNEIYSFEPVSHIFKQLSHHAANNENWKVFNVAVGDQNTQLTINVSGGHGGSSSMLEMTKELLNTAPDQKVIANELVDVITLNDFYKDHQLKSERIFLKIDVQGFEMNVLKGCSEIFNQIVGIKIETSIIKQYKDESDIHEILPFLIAHGFAVYSFEDGWRNPNSKELLQIDIFLFNKSKF